MIRGALIEQHGTHRVHDEMRRAEHELARRGIPSERFSRKALDRRRITLAPDLLVVGEVGTVESALRQLGREVPLGETYPEVLVPFLGRRVWPTTLGAARQLAYERGEPFFVKPRERIKRFTGFVCGGPEDLFRAGDASARLPVWCGEVVRFVAEHRVFVVDGRVVGVRPYDGDATVAPDMRLIERTLDAWSRSGVAAAGHAIDFGVLDDGRTVLVELNDGFSIGAYDLDPAAYLDVLIARWCELAGALRIP